MTAYSALKRANPSKGDNSLVIVSAGGLGLLALQIAKAAYDINPIIVDIDDDTVFFIINTLNQLNVYLIRNKLLLKVLPLKV